MSQTAITLAFEQWKASQAVTGEPVLLDEFVFANVPGLDASKPIDRSETLPPAAQIVHRQAVSRKGVVNENAVVHSVVLGAEVGDFSFNWIGLINKASNTLAMIVHAPLPGMWNAHNLLKTAFSVCLSASWSAYSNASGHVPSSTPRCAMWPAG